MHGELLLQIAKQRARAGAHGFFNLEELLAQEGLLLPAANSNLVAGHAFEHVNAVRDGLPYSLLELLQAVADLSAAATAKVLGIPERTLARRKKEGKLTAEESDRLDRVQRVVNLGIQVLGDDEKLRLWIHAPNRGLGGVVPLDLLDTDYGVRAVEDVLRRLEYGNYG